MDPQYAPTPPQNNYDFLNTQPNAKKPFGGGRNPKQNLLVSVIFIVVVLVVLVIAFIVFRSLTKKDYSVYKSLVTQQTEIARIAGMGIAKARDSSVKSYAATIYSVTQSEKNDTLAFAKLAGLKISDKELATSAGTNNDSQLTAAEASNQYDQKLTDILDKLIIAYQKDVQTLTAGANSKSEKAIVVKLQNNAKVIANAPVSP